MVDYDKPRSICACGHTGDGCESEHNDGPFSNGHGSCRKCRCRQFTWDTWTAEFRKFMDFTDANQEEGER